MKVRTQQNFNRKTYETVFGISIMPDGGRRYCKYPIGHQEYKDYTQAYQAMKDVPVKLYAEILRKNAKEGDKIFDSHLGSGSSRIAAYGLGFDFYATEIDEEYFEAQEERFHRECFGEIKTERGRLVQTNLFDK